MTGSPTSDLAIVTVEQLHIRFRTRCLPLC